MVTEEQALQTPAVSTSVELITSNDQDDEKLERIRMKIINLYQSLLDEDSLTQHFDITSTRTITNISK